MEPASASVFVAAAAARRFLLRTGPRGARPSQAIRYVYIIQNHTHIIDKYTILSYFIHMRTNIELNDGLIQKARKLTGLKTKKAIVEEALRVLIRMHQQKKVRALRGKLEWQGDLKEMRETRFADTR
jgi:Arc/MetJ family transcription regulator